MHALSCGTKPWRRSATHDLDSPGKEEDAPVVSRKTKASLPIACRKRPVSFTKEERKAEGAKERKFREHNYPGGREGLHVSHIYAAARRRTVKKAAAAGAAARAY